MASQEIEIFAPVQVVRGELVVRQPVPEVNEYGEYRRYLRHDFFYSCAYCTLTEAEAATIRFTIDHFEPSSISPHLEKVYENLMYTCDTCNIRKGDLWPPEVARDAGIRYFRPDLDLFQDHFAIKVSARGIELQATSPVGEFSIEQIDLNRQALLRLREIRANLLECHKFVAYGIRQLRNFSVDQLPQHIKAKAQRAIVEGVEIIQQYEQQIDDLLREYARSHLADPDTEAEERALTRKTSQKNLQGLFPGLWRAPKRKRSTK